MTTSNGELQLIVSGNSSPVLHSSYLGGTLFLSWLTIGFALESQTNTLGVGLGTNWVIVAGSTQTNQLAIPVDPNNGAVFFRLANP